MISIDPSSPKPVTEQLVEQLRYKLASGHYKLGEVMPSTRQLADQVDVSFHSVRKAYQALEREGLLQARQGAGYIVKERIPLGKADRIEQGAALVRKTMEQLIGHGLDEREIEYVFQEQLDLLESGAGASKVVFVASCIEIAGLCAKQLSFAVQQPVEIATLQEFSEHLDADYLVTPFETLRLIMEASPRHEVIGISTYLHQDSLEHVSRLLNHQTVGIVTLYADTIQPLTAQLRQQSGFDGQIFATSLERSSTRLDEFVRQTDLLLYTPDCRRRMVSTLNKPHPNTSIAPIISRESLDRVRGIITS